MKVKVVLVPFFGKADPRNNPPGVEAVIEILKRLAPKAEKAGVFLGLESWLFILPGTPFFSGPCGWRYS
jgi:hypothetical protein